jgi:glucose/arabinose dehydrogenase
MRHVRVVPLAALLALLVVAAPAAALPPGFQATPVFAGLSNPTSVRFAPSGTKVFVAEKRGTVQAYDGPDDTTATQVTDLRTETYNFWDRGLLGLAVDPQYPVRPYLYVLYTRDALPGGNAPAWGAAGADSDGCPTPPGATAQGCVASGRLARLTIDPATDKAVGPPTTLVDGWCQQFPSHSIGDLRFVGGQLYASAGDGASFNYADFGQTLVNGVNPCGDPANEGGALRAQDLLTGADPLSEDGSILRVNPDTGAHATVAHGFRNPFRISNRPGTSELWIGDVGWNTWEEVDRFDTAGPTPRNYGWPCYEGNGKQGGYQANALCTTLYGAGAGAWVPPHWTYDHGAAVSTCGSGGSSVSGLAFYPGGDFPDSYDGGLFVSDYSRDCIWFMTKGANGLPDPATVTTFASGGFHPVELELGPDGALYAPDLNGGRVMRVSYNKPTAVATATPTDGVAPLTVQFNGSGSTGAGLSFAWDLDGDGQYDDATTVSPSRTYAAGISTARLRVTDANGVVALSSPITISAGNTRPTATIDRPTAATSWAANQSIAFAGHGTDPQDGALGAARLQWSVEINHCPSGCHIHPLQSFPGVASGSFVAPDHEFPSYLTLSLTVTDTGGLQNTATVRLDPRTVRLTVDSAPAGLQVALDDEAGPAPLTKTVIEGSSNSVSTTTPQNGLAFAGWSDGGGASHQVVPAADTTLVARFAPPGGGGGSPPGGGTAPAGGGPPQAPVTLPPTVRPPVVGATITRLVRLRHALVVGKDGTLPWRVRCRATVSCPATLALRPLGSSTATLARASLRVPAGTTRSVKLRLRRSARARLRARGALRAVCVVQLRPAQGRPRRTDTVLRLRAPAAWGRR